MPLSRRRINMLVSCGVAALLTVTLGAIAIPSSGGTTSAPSFVSSGAHSPVEVSQFAEMYQWMEDAAFMSEPDKHVAVEAAGELAELLEEKIENSVWVGSYGTMAIGVEPSITITGTDPMPAALLHELEAASG